MELTEQEEEKGETLVERPTQLNDQYTCIGMKYQEVAETFSGVMILID